MEKTLNRIKVCLVADIEPEEALRFDHEGETYAIIRSPEGDFFATDGWCTHEKSHLAEGFVDGDIIECSRHSGQFDYRTGEAVELPACIHLRTHPVERDGDTVYLLLAAS